MREQEPQFSQDELLQMQKGLYEELQKIKDENPLPPEHYSIDVGQRVAKIAADLKWIEKQLARFK